MVPPSVEPVFPVANLAVPEVFEWARTAASQRFKRQYHQAGGDDVLFHL
jgi:hypothetical protein